MSVEGFLSAQGWGMYIFEITFFIGYKLPKFWEYNSAEIIHQNVSVRPLGAGFVTTNIHYIFLYSYWI